jgi:hypothetical protein
MICAPFVMILVTACVSLNIVLITVPLNVLFLSLLSCSYLSRCLSCAFVDHSKRIDEASKALSLPLLNRCNDMATQRMPLGDFIDNRKDDIIDFINMNLKAQFTPTGDMYDRLANQVKEEYPYGSVVDNMHRFLTNAIMCALWCG